MSTELMTPKEIERAKLHSKIIQQYKGLRVKYGNGVADSRLYKLIAERIGWTSQGVRNVIVNKYGVNRD